MLNENGRMHKIAFGVALSAFGIGLKYKAFGAKIPYYILENPKK